MLTSLPDLETQGGNLMVEAMLRGIRMAAAERKCTSFRNIYVQLDNVNSNKCGTVIVACALLVALGICRKIKVNFLEVGHTHEDIDALIGSIVTKLRAQDLPTFEARMNAIQNALTKAEAHVKAVEEVVGIPDYDSSLKSFFPTVSGISKLKEFRITMDSTLQKPVFLYKSDPTVDGWYPRPFERLHDFDAIGEVFQHPDPEAGFPTSVVSVVPGSSLKSGELGKRQHWFHHVRFARGDTMVFPLRCNGILIDIPDHLNIVVNDIKPQVFDKKLRLPASRETILGNICDLLVAHDGTEHRLVELMLI